MSGNLLLYTLCLLVNTPILLTARSKTNDPQIETPSSYESLEILPYISSKLADRTNIMPDKIDEHDKEKLLSLFTNTKKEVKDAEVFLSAMLRVLQNLFARKPLQENGKPTSKQNNGGQNIAWSYYDDLGK